MLLNLCSTLLQTSVLGQCQRTVYEKPSLGDPGAVGGIRATCKRWTAFLFSTFHELRFRLALTHKGGDNSQFAFAGPGISIVGGGSACSSLDD
jgi:hypothetical protein